MMDRFSDEQCQLLKEIAIFSCINLKKGCSIKPTDIAALTSTYSLNRDDVVSEYEDFSLAFRTLNVPESEMTDIPFIDDVSYTGDSKDQGSSGEDSDEVQLPAQKEKQR